MTNLSKKQLPISELVKYLLANVNSHSRESLVNNKMFFDLKLEAAKMGYFLNVYFPEVDKDGFDIILDDQDHLIKIQVKTVMKKATTSEWSIHKALLRPLWRGAEKLGFPCDPNGIGYEGGVILIEIDAQEEFKLTYYYTDIIILFGIKEKVINLKSPPNEKTMDKLFSNLANFSGLHSSSSHEVESETNRVSVTKNMFIRAKDPAGLLALMGLATPTYNSAWRGHIENINADDERWPRIQKERFINNELSEISLNSIKIPKDKK